MMKISLCMIVKNEEEVLARCLESVRGIADEIIIVDTGSTDRTKEIARQFTDKVYDFRWIDDFSAARNFGIAKAGQDFVMWLDADDVIEGENRTKILALKKDLDPNIDFIYLKYNVAFNADGTPTFSYFRERIMRNCPQAVFLEPIHEAMCPFGNTYYSDAAISHRKVHAAAPDRNLKIYESYLAKGHTLSTRMKFYYARELKDNGLHQRAVKAYQSFLRQKDGFCENQITACRDLYRCQKAADPASADVKVLFQSFEYAAPRAEITSEIGTHFFEKSRYPEAEFWYRASLSIMPDENSLGFLERDYYNYIPLMQLCVICDRTGRKKEAEEYNRRAGSIKPDSPAYLMNLKYFEQIRENRE